MTGFWRAWIESASALALTVLASGCGQVLDYPGVSRETTVAACSDGIDNDLDGKIDCQDQDCRAYCREDTDAACHDGKDNDLDGNSDCKDSECKAYCVESSQAACSDGIDNDQNGKTDCDDGACAKFCPEADAKACSDGVDNDFDTLIDCLDPDCDGFCPEASAEACRDGRDNDGDGVVDGADPQCWPLLPPQAQRCAEASGVDLLETFDAGPQSKTAGSPWSVGVFADFHRGAAPTGRQDLLLGLTQPTIFRSCVSAQRAFSGSWQGFELSFRLSDPPNTLLQAQIEPATAQKHSGAPFALILDTTHVPPMLKLVVEGEQFVAYSDDLASAPANLLSGPAEPFSELKVVLDEQGFYATLTRPSADPSQSGESVLVAELRARPPSSLSLPPSRLAFCTGSTALHPEAAVDDLRLHVSAERPCGFTAPQIPGAVCESKDELHAFGQQVSVAHANDGQQCALVTASRDAYVLTPETLTAWSSADGETWAPASPLGAPPVKLPPGAPLIGAGIAHDSEGWHVVVASAEADGVRLGLASGANCGLWGPLTPGPLLPLNAEPPSYVIANGRHDVYFTLPPGDQARRTLWRVTRGESDSVWLEPELLSDLSPSVASPVTVQQVGARDLVLVHPSAPTSVLAGVGVLVSDADARSWKAVDPSPLLALPPLQPNSFAGQLAFDELGATSAALSWSGNARFLLYGGSSAVGFSSGYEPLLSVGTARLAPAGEAFSEPASTPRGGCGDGICDGRETCAICPADCPCGPPPLLTNVFTPEASWQRVSGDPYPAAVQYLDFQHATMNWAGASPINEILGGAPLYAYPATWSALPLQRPIVGDFELSFDYLSNWIDPPEPSCALYIGLGTVPELAGANPAPRAGIFARASWSSCEGKYWAKPSVHTAGSVFEAQNESAGDPYSCLLERYWTAGKPRKMRLRREGDRVTLGVARDYGCGFAERTISYAGALPDLSAVLVGFGGADFASCKARSGAGTLSNLELRLLDDPKQCPANKRLCGGASQEPSCVDTTNSVEHCGACGHACAANQVCKDGSCAAEVTDISWVTFDDNGRAPADRAPNGDLGIDGLLVGHPDDCAAFSWDPKTRCATGTLCGPGLRSENSGVAINFNFRTTGGADSPLTLPWDPSGVGVRGVAWEVSGRAPGLQVWALNMDPAWIGQCNSVLCDIAGPADGTPKPALHGQLFFDDMAKDNWGLNGVRYTFDPKALVALQFKLPIATIGGRSFQFCIDRLGVIR